MSINDQPDLLFFDTFSHDTSEELNLDLVQFPKSVFVREIRIIPLGARVQGDFPGGVRLGATNPTQFHIDFFVNDLSKPGASTFESLGSLEYSQNGQIHMECINTAEQPRIPTDGLVLKGWYTTITLAVYGNLSQVISDDPGPNQSQVARPSIPRDVVPVQTNVPQSQDWNPEPPNPIPTYTGNLATSNPEVYGPGAYGPENYDSQVYRSDYYDSNAPKDPRTYHHMEDNDWEKDRSEMSCERDSERLRISPRLDHERDRERREVRSHRRSLDRRSRESSRHGDHSRDLDRRSRSRDREYVVKGEYRTVSRSRSRSGDRLRGMSSERDWDRASYKKDDYRRRRDSSYDRSRAGSYDKRSASYERRSPAYDKRAPSYERKSYEKRSPYDKRGSSYERRASSYEKQAPFDKKRHSPYSRVRDSSYGSRSPSRDDSRKRPRTPEGRRPLSPRERETDSPITSVRSEEGAIEYDRSGKPIPRVDFYQSYRHKSSIRSPSQEMDNPSYVEPQHTTLVTVQIVDSATSKPAVVASPIQTQDEDRSMDEPFEPILSDEDICDDLEGSPYMDADYDVSEYCGVEDIIKYYNPFKSEWVKYEHINQIHLLAAVKREGTKDVLTATFNELTDACPDLMKVHELAKSNKKRDQKFCESNFSDIDNSSREDWVHQCEQLVLLVTNLCKDTDIILRIFNQSNKMEESEEFIDMFNLLITFCKIGLNFDLALAQQVSTYKIRHMKCGIRLAEALVSHRHNGQVVQILIQFGIHVPIKLLEMYSKDYMALSIRLMALKALNGCLSSKESVESFMQEAVFPQFDKSDNENKLKNGYQALISIMQSNPLSRIKFSISALIKKLNMYELLGKLQELVLNFNKSVETNQTEEVEISEKDTEFIVHSFDEILYMFRSHCFHISQPKRFLPVSAQFDINKDCSNEILLQFFDVYHLLDVCLYLLTCPTTCNNLVITSPIHDLIYEMVYSHNGLKFLYKNMGIAELVFKTLMQPYGLQNSDDFIYPHDISNYSDLQILGLELAYRLKSMYYLKSIYDLQAGQWDENELIDRLQSLYCLSFGNIGKTAVPDILAMDDNAECIIKIFEKDMRLKCKNESQTKQKSPAKGYAVDLIASAVKYSANVPFLKKYGLRILNVAREHDMFETSVSSQLQEVTPYLKPVENSSLLSGDDIAECVEILKNSLDAATSFPGELITCLRILRHFCISDYERNATVACESATEEYVELKYKYNVLQLFSLDGVVHLCAILDSLTAHFEQPSVHSSLFASITGLHLAQIVLPCLRLLGETLARVVKCRGSKFRDTTAAPTLLKTYGLVRAFPSGCVGYRTAARAADAAVGALLAFAQPAADDADDGDSIGRGPWTTLCSEAIAYTTTAPHTFVPGLTVFSELLPLPLPMQTETAPTPRELADAADERRLWSAHLHALGGDLADMIQTICASTYRPVAHTLRRVCVQIADLAPNTAAVVWRAAAAVVAREVAAPVSASTGAPAPAGAPASAAAARALGFFACLVAHAPVKCALLHAAAGGSGGGGAATAEAAAGALRGALAAVLGAAHAGPEHAAAQEYAAHTLGALCDAEVSLAGPGGAGALPTAEFVAGPLRASADCLASATKTCAVASAVLRVYFVLTEHEYGFRLFRKLIADKKDAFAKFFEWLVESGGEETAECLSFYIDLLRILRVEEGEGPVGRRSVLTVAEVADLVGYSPERTDHPALTLETIIKERNGDEEVIANATFLSSCLSRLGEAETRAAAASPPPCAAGALATVWAARAVRGAGDAADERLTAAYWLHVPDATTDEDLHEDLVSCDIAEIARTELAGSGGVAALAAALRRLAGLAPAPLEPGGGRRGGGGAGMGAGTHARAGAATTAGAAVASDTFRSRPPNTSRPPSLHVDDFTAMERAPTAYGKPAPNRGMRRGLAPERGRFASTTPHHAHYRHIRGRGAWEMPGQHFGHFAPSAHYMMGGMGWGGARMQRGPRHRAYMR